jgi:hypothetical protein
MKDFLKTLSIFILNLFWAIPTYAQLVDQQDLHFKVQTEKLLQGQIHYAFRMMEPRELAEKHPFLYELDSLSFLQEGQTKVIVSKVSYIVNKASGFFDHENSVNENFVARTMGQQEVKKIGPHSFQIKVPGQNSYSYKMRTYYDSDDITTLPNSKITQAVLASRKMDVISQSASSTIFKEFTDFSKYTVGGVSVTAYVPLKEEKTLVITYQLTGVKKYYALEKLIRDNFLKEISAVKKLTERY